MECSDNLAAFVLARVSEDEVDAKRAAADDPVWTASVEETCDGDGIYFSVQGRRTGNFLLAMEDSAAVDQARITHIARHDPARVLAECAAKRETVGDFTEADRAYRDAPTEFGEGRRFAALMAVSRLAEAHATHPDYREEYRA